MKQPLEILIVEDNPGDVALVRIALQRARLAHRLSDCENGIQALNYLRRMGDSSPQARPDIIFLDLNLPKFSGEEVLEIIKSDPSLESIPVIVLTGTSSDTPFMKFPPYPKTFFFTKPYTFDDYERIVRVIEPLVASES